MNTDSELTTLLGDYAAPVADDGFTDAVMSALPTRRRTAVWRAALLPVAVGVGAAAWAWALGRVLPELALDVSALASVPWLWAALPAGLGVVWLTLEPELG